MNGDNTRVFLRSLAMIYRRSAPTRAFDLRVHDDAQRWRVTFVCIGAILFANVFDPIRTVVRSSVNRKQPSKILRPSRVNIMLKQSETLNIVPIARNSVFVYRAAPLAPISLRIFRASLRSAIAVFFFFFFLFEKRRDPCNECCRNACRTCSEETWANRFKRGRRALPAPQ